MTVATIVVAVVLVLAVLVLLFVAYDRSPEGTGAPTLPVTQHADLAQTTRTALVGGAWALGLATLLVLVDRTPSAPPLDRWVLLGVGFVGFPLMAMAALEAAVLVRKYRTQATSLRDQLHETKAELKEQRRRG